MAANHRSRDHIMATKQAEFHAAIGVATTRLMDILPKHIVIDETCEYLIERLNQNMETVRTELTKPTGDERKEGVWSALEKVIYTVPLSAAIAVQIMVKEAEATMSVMKVEYLQLHGKWLDICLAITEGDTDEDGHDQEVRRVEALRQMNACGQKLFFSRSVLKIALPVQRMVAEITEETKDPCQECGGIKSGA